MKERQPDISIGWLCVDAADPVALARWWSELVGGEVNVDQDGEAILRGGDPPGTSRKGGDGDTRVSRIVVRRPNDIAGDRTAQNAE